MCRSHFQTPVKERRKRKKNTALKPPMPSKVGQGSGTAHGYETDIDSQGQAMKTGARTLSLATYFLSSHRAGINQ